MTEAAQGQRRVAIGDQGQRWFAAQLPPGWFWQPPLQDVGKDALVVVHDGSQLHNLEFSVQVKSTERPLVRGDSVVISGVPRSSVVYWFASPLPTLVVLVDIAAHQAWYGWHLNLFESPSLVFQTRAKTLTIRLPVNNRLDERGWDNIRAGLWQHFRRLQEIIDETRADSRLIYTIGALMTHIGNLHKLSRRPPPSGPEVTKDEYIHLVLEQWEHRALLKRVQGFVEHLQPGSVGALHLDAWVGAYEAVALDAFPSLLALPEPEAWDDAIGRPGSEPRLTASRALVSDARYYLIQAGLDLVTLLTFGPPTARTSGETDAAKRANIPIHAQQALEALKQSSQEAHKRREVAIVLVTVSNLGFPNGATTAEVIGTEYDRDDHGHIVPFSRGRGTELGLSLCPADVGLEYRLHYKDQPPGERVRVAMRPLEAEDEPRVFVLDSTVDGLSIDAVRARPDDHWPATDVVLFIQPAS